MLWLEAGNSQLGLPKELLAEIMRPLPLTALVGAPAGVIGMAVVRGKPTAVLDLGLVLFGKPCSQARRWVLLKLERPLALQVDAVIGFQKPAASEPLDPLLKKAAPMLQGALAEDARLQLVLSKARLMEIS